MRLPQFTKFIVSAILLLTLETTISAGNIITSDGRQYTIDANTILLDREQIYQDFPAYTDARSAFDRINETGTNVTLLVAPSVYWLDNPDDPEIRTDKGGTPFAIRIKCDSLHIVGLCDNPEDVVFAVNRGQTQGAAGNFTMFEFEGNCLTTENITFGNYCNIDLIYPRNPDLNRSRRKDAIVQAQIGICNNTDRLYANNCRFLSRLNLCPFVGARRSLYDNCYFESTDDALSGSAVYLGCSFLFCSSKPFYSTSETGAIFLDCDIKSLCSGQQYFTKVPGQVAAIDTRFTATDNLSIAWTRDTSDVRCFQHNITLNGKAYTIDADRPELWTDLGESSLMDAYVVECDGKRFYNLPNLLNGDDGWDPKNLNKTVAEAEKILGRNLSGIPVAVRMTTDKGSLEAKNDTATITATPLLWGGYPAGAPTVTTYVSDNGLPHPIEETISHTMPNGLTASQTIRVAPLLREPPRFKKKPSLKFDKTEGCYHVDYKLTGKGQDISAINWVRIVEEDTLSRAFLIKKSNRDDGYTPVAADYGNKLMAVVVPQFSDSRPGELVWSDPIAIEDIDAIKDYPESELFTDFSDIPITARKPGCLSVWCFDVFKPHDTRHVTNWEATDGAGWYFGKGYDASVSEGLVQDARGARLSYYPTRDTCRDMKVELTAEPAKSGGQGFGSATTQYMDICLKFDPVDLDGYALRIERTADHDRAVRFSLVRYDKGISSVINEGVVSNCFRTPCHIAVEITDGILTATASSDASPADPCCSEVVPEVHLSSPVTTDGLAGFCIQHTGSTGPSSTLLKDLKLIWR